MKSYYTLLFTEEDFLTCQSQHFIFLLEVYITGISNGILLGEVSSPAHRALSLSAALLCLHLCLSVVTHSPQNFSFPLPPEPFPCFLNASSAVTRLRDVRQISILWIYNKARFTESSPDPSENSWGPQLQQHFPTGAMLEGSVEGTPATWC